MKTMEERERMRMLEQWVEAYQPTVYRAAYLVLRDPHTAEDVAQETFLRAYHAAPRLRPDSNVGAWLYRIAANTALNQLRSRRREVAAVRRLGGEHTGGPDPAELRATRSVVAEALDRLPDRLRVPVVLRYYLDLPERDIARELGVRPGTVKSRLHEARRQLAGDAGVAAAGGGEDA